MERLPFFVYGTLRNGLGNYRNILEGCTFSEETALFIGGDIYPVYPRGGFPVLVADSDGEVKGELMHVIEGEYDEVARKLDLLEGYMSHNEEHSMYLRRKAEVLVGGDWVECWVYLWNRSMPVTDKIKDGCWKGFLNQQVLEFD